MASEGDKYIPNGVWLRCDKGAKPAKLKILPKTVKLYGENWAAQFDAVPYVNIPTFGVCAITHVLCVPATAKWDDVKEDVNILGQKAILSSSTCQCNVGGTIKIYFSRQAADDAGAEQDAKEKAEFWGKVGAGLLLAGAVVGTIAIVAATGGGALVVLAGAAATGAAIGGVGGAVAGGISGGAEGAVSGFFTGAAFGALGGLATATGAGVVAGALALGAGAAGLTSLGFLGKAYYHNPSQENGLVLVGAAAGMLAGGLTGRALTPKTSTVYRAQGGAPPNASWRRVNINEKGNVSIGGDRNTMLHISLDDKNHAVYFYNKRGGTAADAEVVSFKIPKKLADEIRKGSVPQDQGRKFPGSPQKVDPTRSGDAYGIKRDWIDRIEKGAIPGSGRITKPKQK